MRPLCLALLGSLLVCACNDHKPSPPPSVVLHVTDADSRADVIGARVVAEPGSIEATTDSSGRASFAGLEAGSYKFTVFAPGLELAGSTMKSGGQQTATSEEITLAADETNRQVELGLRRIDREKLNLDALHDGRNGAFAVDNCKACHNDRRYEISTEPGIRPWHAIKTHASQPCTWCHRTVDLTNYSGGTLRKQVNVALCVDCHPRFPSFPSSL